MFGSKADRDLKSVKPILEKILATYPEIDKLGDDELRAHSEALKMKLRAVEEPFEKRIAEIKDELNKDIPVSEKESLASESDKLVKDEDEAIEKCPLRGRPRQERPQHTQLHREDSSLPGLQVL